MANGTIASPVGWKAVRDALGESTLDEGRLCKSPRVNKWARYKPVKDPRLFAQHDYAHRKPLSAGFDFTTIAFRDPRDISDSSERYLYIKPDGGVSDPFRIPDFVGYYHLASQPIVISGFRKLEMNSTGERLWVSRADQVSDYNISIDDITSEIPGFNPEEWRLAVALCNLDPFSDEDELASFRHFWTSEYSWGDEREDAREVIVNANLITGLNNGDRVGLVVFLLKTGEDWNYNVNGYDQSLLPVGNTFNDFHGIALPVDDGNDHIIVDVVRNQVYDSIRLVNLTFRAYREVLAGDVPGTWNAKCNLYVITDVSVQFDVKVSQANYDYLNNTYVRVTMVLSQYYKVYDDGRYEWRDDSDEIELGRVKLGEYSINDGDDESGGGSITPSDTLMHLDYTAGMIDTMSEYYIRVYAYRINTPGSEVLLKVEEFEYNHSGNATIIGFDKLY